MILKRKAPLSLVRTCTRAQQAAAAQQTRQHKRVKWPLLPAILAGNRLLSAHRLLLFRLAVLVSWDRRQIASARVHTCCKSLPEAEGRRSATAGRGAKLRMQHKLL